MDGLYALAYEKQMPPVMQGHDCSEEQCKAARHLIRWCLQGDPQKRPTDAEILAHPFLAPNEHTLQNNIPVSSVEELYEIEVETPISAINCQPLEYEVRSRSVARMVYHVFISHMQTEVPYT